jgi:ribosomal protein S6
MRNYELTLLFASEIVEEKIQELVGELAGFLQGKGALLGKQWARREGKAKVGVLAFTVSSEVLLAAEQFLKGKKEILRFMLSIAPVKPLETPVIMKPAIQLPEEQKVSMEDIDKKLEEIFKTTP